MVVIKKQYFVVTVKIIKALLMVWDIEWKREVNIRKREISCLVADVVIGLCRGLWGEEVFLTSMK